MSTSPIVARWELSLRLSRRRKELGLGVPAVTAALEFSRNYWSAIENDRTVISEEKLKLLFDVFRFNATEQEELLQLRRDIRQRGWWDDYPQIDHETRRFFGLEDGAKKIRAYESNLIPGLLQVPEYALAFLESDPAFSPLEAKRRVDTRVHRQRLLSDSDPLTFTALLSEAALLQQVGGAEVQRQQLQHLIDLLQADHPSLEIRIVPFEATPGIVANASTLLLFDFGSPHLPDMVWQETIIPSEVFLSGGPEFERLGVSWDDGLAASLSTEDSAELIEQKLGELT